MSPNVTKYLVMIKVVFPKPLQFDIALSETGPNSLKSLSISEERSVLLGFAYEEVFIFFWSSND